MGAGCARRGSPQTRPSCPDSASPPTPTDLGAWSRTLGQLQVSAAQAVTQGMSLGPVPPPSLSYRRSGLYHLTNPNSDSTAVVSHF